MAQNLEQTLGGLRKTDTFIQEGIQSTGDYALQFLNACPELTGDQIGAYKDIMRDYLSIQSEVNAFLQAAEKVKSMVFGSTIEGKDIQSKLETEVSLQTNAMSQSVTKKFQEFETQLHNAVHGEPGRTVYPDTDDDEDLAVEEETQSHKCPYTGKEMVDPVRNTNCGHCYDREGILAYIVQKRHKARCPYSACANQAPVTQKCLVPDHQLKAEIKRKHQRMSQVQ